MMSERTLIVVNDYDIYKGDKDALAAVLRELPDYVCLVFVYDLIEYKADARTKLAALLKEKGSVVPFNRQGQGDLVDWISRRFKAMDHDIGTEAVSYTHLDVYKRQGRNTPSTAAASPPRKARDTAHRQSRLASGPARETDWKCQAVRGVVKAMAPRLTARLDRTNRARCV